MSIERVHEIARANANMAIDQIDSPDYNDSISAFAQNVRDSLAEEDLRNYRIEGLRVYYLRIAELLSIFPNSAPGPTSVAESPISPSDAGVDSGAGATNTGAALYAIQDQNSVPGLKSADRSPDAGADSVAGAANTRDATSTAIWFIVRRVVGVQQSLYYSGDLRTGIWVNDIAKARRFHTMIAAQGVAGVYYQYVTEILGECGDKVWSLTQ